jgi:hypothetical protein
MVLVARTKGSDPDRHERKARTVTKSTANPAGTGPPGNYPCHHFAAHTAKVHMTAIGHKERHNRTTIVELTRPLLPPGERAELWPGAVLSRGQSF